MKREWKPGDVAMRIGAFDSTVALAVPWCPVSGHADGMHWHLANGGWNSMPGMTDYRPLVVIDPEDREQVERLNDCLYAASFNSGNAKDDHDLLASALREFADPTPPKPDEPMGLGAVVETAEGERWVRTDEGLRVWSNGFTHEQRWDDIVAVRVLAEGMQS